jgi:drug/metabolite transporter (DMT)-like permease
MTPDASTHPAPQRALLITAFLAVYIIWGSTYMAIRVAIDTLPPFLMAATRFLIAGFLFLALLYARGVAMPNPLQWRNAFISGNLLLLGGNGLVVWAEQTVPSGRAALIIATAPAWFSLLEWLRPGGTRPKVQTVIGIAVGFAGVSLLINRSSAGASAGLTQAAGMLAVVAATASWAGGSLFAKHSAKPNSPWMNVATQMICGGVGLLLAGLLMREPAHIHWTRFSTRSLWALAYLIVFGSWVAFSAYVWLLKHTTPAKLSTYAYVNPVIAVFLGWAILHETVSPRTLLAAAVILTGVIIITLPAAVVGRLFRRCSTAPTLTALAK